MESFETAIKTVCMYTLGTLRMPLSLCNQQRNSIEKLTHLQWQAFIWHGWSNVIERL